MGESTMKLKAPSASEKLIAAAPRVSAVLRRLAPEFSEQPGRDAVFHMEIGQVLLADLGIHTHRAFGFAAWRVGPGNGDILSYHPSALGSLPQGADSLPYQAWLEFQSVIIDFTTYQFERKAKELDAVDGRTTCVEWCPHYLLIPHAEVRSLRKVTDATYSGLTYYQAVPKLYSIVDSGAPPSEAAVQKARALFKSADLTGV
jgi:hypothetical protein